MTRRAGTILLVALALGLGGQAEAAPTLISACGTLSAPGAYVLDQSLTHSGNGSCLLIAADFVTLDLAGFTISGDGNGLGITDGSTARVGIAIRGGTVHNFDIGIGLAKTTGAVVEEMRVFKTGFGVSVGRSSLFRFNVVSGNAPKTSDVAVIIGESSLVAGNVVSEKAFGLDVFDGSTVTGNTVSENTKWGLFTGRHSTVSNNTASTNVFEGLGVGCPSNIVANTAVGNGTNLLSGPGCNDVDNLAP
jgi:parallel beta-helix repeat protein